MDPRLVAEVLKAAKPDFVGLKYAFEAEGVWENMVRELGEREFGLGTTEEERFLRSAGVDLDEG